MEMCNDRRDGKTYATVRIGNQLWLSQNLAFIPHVGPPASDDGIWVYGYEGSDPAEARATPHYETYGCLYNLDSALAAAPEGWHVPTEDDWNTLMQFFGPGGDHGNKMKQPGLWKSDSFASNSSGFSALPGGSRNLLGEFNNLGSRATFWSSTDWAGSGDFWIFILEDISPTLRANPVSREWGLSVRCIKD